MTDGVASGWFSTHGVGIIRICQHRRLASTLLARRRLSSSHREACAEAGRVGHAAASGKAQQVGGARAGADVAPEAAPNEDYSLASTSTQ